MSVESMVEITRAKIERLRAEIDMAGREAFDKERHDDLLKQVNAAKKSLNATADAFFVGHPDEQVYFRYVNTGYYGDLSVNSASYTVYSDSYLDRSVRPESGVSDDLFVLAKGVAAQRGKEIRQLASEIDGMASLYQRLTRETRDRKDDLERLERFLAVHEPKESP